ncbi:ThiF family adenylyltransferase, partial [Acidithiobacillus thiooxidans]
MTHRYLFQKPNDGSFYATPTIVVIGAGGTGSQLLTGLSRMVVALQSLNMAAPEVIVCDPDTVSRANVGRQLFSPSDIGQSKAHTLVNRINQYFGLNWQSYHGKFTPKIAKSRVIYISCVDSRSARQEIYEAIKESASY